MPTSIPPEVSTHFWSWKEVLYGIWTGSLMLITVGGGVAVAYVGSVRTSIKDLQKDKASKEEFKAIVGTVEIMRTENREDNKRYHERLDSIIELGLIVKGTDRRKRCEPSKSQRIRKGEANHGGLDREF